MKIDEIHDQYPRPYQPRDNGRYVRAQRDGEHECWVLLDAADWFDYLKQPAYAAALRKIAVERFGAPVKPALPSPATEQSREAVPA